jgi:hypothetical protein
MKNTACSEQASMWRNGRVLPSSHLHTWGHSPRPRPAEELGCPGCFQLTQRHFPPGSLERRDRQDGTSRGLLCSQGCAPERKMP